MEPIDPDLVDRPAVQNLDEEQLRGLVVRLSCELATERTGVRNLQAELLFAADDVSEATRKVRARVYRELLRDGYEQAEAEAAARQVRHVVQAKP